VDGLAITVVMSEQAFCRELAVRQGKGTYNTKELSTSPTFASVFYMPFRGSADSFDSPRMQSVKMPCRRLVHLWIQADFQNRISVVFSKSTKTCVDEPTTTVVMSEQAFYISIPEGMLVLWCEWHASE
jgi:hypothetical protein